MFPTKMLLATDGSPDAARAARMAVGLSERLDTRCTSSTSSLCRTTTPVVAATLYYPGHLLPEARERAGRRERRKRGSTKRR